MERRDCELASRAAGALRCTSRRRGMDRASLYVRARKAFDTQPLRHGTHFSVYFGPAGGVVGDATLGATAAVGLGGVRLKGSLRFSRDAR